MKRLLMILCILVPALSVAQNKEKETIGKLLDNWHQAAADAQLDAYFQVLAPDAIYIGTDATEHWSVDKFRKFCKPYFHNKKTWDFKALERHVFLDETGELAWFDELLDTQMKICRGSGVLRKEKDGWKIVHYVLSMTVPNDNVEPVVKIKTPIEDAYIKTLQQK
ncbi:nuclear transport factor 2 family protein [Flavobacterium caeni]|uniref:SnoaL-like domain-containing protein n=1 Tax=Flavobacterium caeni TaxID=490189 RepID=A0A1G5E223_9FLAO|nr:nuclear transport factor 2 family protein [Flavobacterium caeni]SCY20800.1 SnoaL-like domain-containing protein [Flavobacterium caeni]